MSRRNLLANERGVASVEFALILPLLLLIVLMLIDFARIGFTQISLAAASREGVRYSSLNSSGISNSTSFTNFVISSSPKTAQIAQMQSTGTLTVSFQACATSVPNDNTTVTVSTNFKWLLPLDLLKMVTSSTSWLTDLNLSSSSTMRCMN